MAEHSKQALMITESSGRDTESVDPEIVTEREQWDKKIEYILSMVGYIVGLGNFWRFPYVCMLNGGGAFLIPFVVCLVFVAYPLFFLEVAIGQFTAKSIAHCWEACPLFKGVGIGMVVMNFICSLYYIMVVSWTLNYLYCSFISPLPWMTCDNVWNTDNCTENLQEALGNRTFGNLSNSNYSSDKVTSQEEFWQYRALDMTSGIHNMGSLNINTFICLTVSWILIYFCIMKGVKSVGKVVYVTATLPYILLVVLFVKGCTLPGSADGILFYITPNFSRITDIKVWIEAAIQVFYSTCVCWGPLLTMASYNKFHNNCMRDAAILVTLGEGFSVFCGFVVFSVLGFMAHTNGVPIEQVVKSGPGLIFIAYPEVVAELPLPNFWAVLFFIMVLTIGLDSQFANCEPLISVLCDSYTFFRKRRTIFTGVILAVCLILGIPLCLQGGIYLFQLMDWYIAAFCIPVFGIIECMIFGWIYGAEMFSRDVRLMLGRPIPIFIRILWCFITPVLLLILLISIISNYKPPTYGSYQYPAIANGIGILYALVPLIPLFYYGMVEIVRAPGYSIMEKIRNTLRCTDLWRPADVAERKQYMDTERQYPEWPQRIAWTLGFSNK